MWYSKFTLFCIILLYQLYFVFSDRISDRIYHVFPVESYVHCFRRMNGTHEFGCQSSPSGNVGVLQYLKEASDFMYVIQDGPHPPYIPVINVSDSRFYNPKIFKDLENSKRVNGIIIIRYGHFQFDVSFSPEKKCPNKGYELDGSCDDVVWNPDGNEMLFMKWNLPIFLLFKAPDIEFLLDNCTEKFNSRSNGSVPQWPLCSAELRSYMFAAVDSENCMRRSTLVTNLNPQKRCDPLGDYNVFSPLTVTDSSRNNQPIILIAAKLDAMGMFPQEFAHGLESTVSGIISSLLVAESLAKVRDNLLDKRIYFIFFNGEALDYSGSHRLVYDIQKGEFSKNLPEEESAFSLDQIDLFIELSQLGVVIDDTVYLHTNPESMKNDTVRNKIDKFAAIMKEEASKYSMHIGDLNYTKVLPPASLHTFLKEDKNIPGIVIADHQRGYRNKYYHSFFDNALSWNFSQPRIPNSNDIPFIQNTTFSRNLQKISTVVARSIYRFVTNNASVLEASHNTSATLAYCYTISANCTYWARYFDTFDKINSYLQPQPLNLYVTANQYSSPVVGSGYLAWNTLGYLIGERVQLTKDDCLKPNSSLSDWTYQWVLDIGNTTGQCYRSRAKVSSSRSPAFLLEDYSGKYPAWTESVWTTAQMRIFLQPNPQDDINITIFGSLLTFFATIIIFCINRSASVIFHVPPNPQ